MTTFQASSLPSPDVPLESRGQDVHISCPPDLVETLVVELQMQLVDTPDAEVYDWGQSSRFQQGFIVLSWEGAVPLEFERQLDADPRLEGHSIYTLPVEAPVSIAARKEA